jgi:hypothetical protein
LEAWKDSGRSSTDASWQRQFDADILRLEHHMFAKADNGEVRGGAVMACITPAHPSAALTLKTCLVVCVVFKQMVFMELRDLLLEFVLKQTAGACFRVLTLFPPIPLFLPLRLISRK